ncbi:MAG: putative zinc-binding metallopeptidase, partial [Pyrinomonadaceae bacterium]
MGKVFLRSGKLFLVVALFLAGSAPAYGQTPADAAAKFSTIAQAYHIEIITGAMTFPVKTTYGLIEGKPAERKDLENYSGVFASEFTVYPTSLVKLSRLKRIVICIELSFAGQRRNAIPDFEHDTLYLDPSRGSYSPTYMRKVMHHEFFHIIDYLDDGELYQDERWSSLNPPGFKYGTGGINAQSLSSSSLTTDQFPGFLNYYSTTGVEEDKAELFAFLIVDPRYIEQRIKSDAVVRAKVKFMMELLHTFCPELNDEFWKKV